MFMLLWECSKINWERKNQGRERETVRQRKRVGCLIY